MRVLHGMCYSLPAVVMISYLMWLTKSWASGIALTNLLTGKLDWTGLDRIEPDRPGLYCFVIYE